MRKLALILCLVGCTTTHPTATNNDALVEKQLQSYVVGFLRLNPTANTYFGGAGLDPSLREADGRLRDYSPAALDREDTWLDSVYAALFAINPATLSPSMRINRDVALAQIDFQLHLHRSRRYQERAVDSYTDEPFRAVDFQLQGMTPDDWPLVIARVRSIPSYFTNAEEQLHRGIASKNTADYRMLYRNGITAAESTATYFQETLPQIASERITGPDRDRLLTDLRSASRDAAKAYSDFAAFIRTTFFDDPSRETGVKPQFGGDRFVFGETEYDWALHHNLRISSSAAELYEQSWPIVESTRREMNALAAQIATSHGWTVPAGDSVVRFVFDQLGNDYPKSDAEMVAWYRDAAFRLVDYARRTGMFEVPADYKLEVVETPPPLRASVEGAAYYPAPPFKKTGVGRYYVSPTDNDPALLRENNRSALADLSAHEGFPGHDWYYKVLAADPPAPVRWLTPGAIEDSSSMWGDSLAAEGWALYAEALMAEPPGFYTPEERLYQLQGKILRDVRVRIDTGLHTGRMSYADAVDLYSQIVDFRAGSCRDANPTEGKRASCKTADAAIFRYSKWPTQAVTYRLGKDQIYALREEAKQRLGSRFDLKRFHLDFIRQGTIPPGYFREELLRQIAPDAKSDTHAHLATQ